MATVIRLESQRRFEKHGLAKTREILKKGGFLNPTEKSEAQTWLVEEEARQQHQARRHYWWLLAFLMIAILGAVLGFSPILKEWFHLPV